MTKTYCARRLPKHRLIRRHSRSRSRSWNRKSSSRREEEAGCLRNPVSEFLLADDLPVLPFDSPTVKRSVRPCR